MSAPNRSLFRFILWATAIAFSLRVFFWLQFTDHQLSTVHETVRSGISLAQTGVLGNPYSTPTGPSAHLSPLYPMFLASLYWLFGVGPTAAFIQMLVGCSLAALRTGFLIWIMAEFGFNKITTGIAAALSIIYISALETEIGGSWEAPLSTLLLMGFVIAVHRLSQHNELRLRWAPIWGLVCGLVLLTSAALLLVIAAFAAIGLWRWRKQWKTYLAWVGLASFIGILTLLPWAWRNQRQLGSPILFRSNLGLELFLCYRDQATTNVLEPWALTLHPSVNKNESLEIARIGEVPYNQLKKEKALAWIKSYPLQATSLTAKRAFYFWFAPRPGLVAWIGYALTLTSFAGLWLLIDARRLIAIYIATIWLSFPIIYWIVMWASRYRYPMEWTLLLCTAVFLSRLIQWLAPNLTAPSISSRSLGSNRFSRSFHQIFNPGPNQSC